MSVTQRRWWFGAGMICAVVVGVLVLRDRRGAEQPSGADAASPGGGVGALPGPGEVSSPAERGGSGAGGGPGGALRTRIERVRAADAGELGEAVAGLRAAVRALPSAEASVALREVLDAGGDAPLRQGFVVAPGGGLAEAPTLRVLLLDLLGQVDPAGAAAYARVVLGGMGSADEWAVALRNVARVATGPEGRAYLEERMAVLLQHGPWWEEASAGYLEAFDVAVHVGGTNLLPALAAAVRDAGRPAAAHAAFLALDRLVLRQPAVTLGVLLETPELLAGREATRAGYFARADAGDPAQRRLLEAYLLDPRTGAAELERFSGLYPHASVMISANLLTEPPVLDGATLAARDLAALRAIEAWEADPRFAARRALLGRMRARLEAFRPPP